MLACLQAARTDVQAHLTACLSSFMDAFASADPVAVSSHCPSRRDYGPTAVDCLTTHDDLRDAVELLLATTKLGCEDPPAQAWRMLCDQVSCVAALLGCLTVCASSSKVPDMRAQAWQLRRVAALSVTPHMCRPAGHMI